MKAIAAIFEHMKRESSSDKVYAAIREAILSGKLKTGQRLTELQLAQDFDVSRVVIRETLQRLAHDGLVVQKSYKGTFVVRLRPEEVDEILSLRALLEVEAVRQAKPRLTEADKKVFRQLAKKLDSLAHNTQLHHELDLKLHEKIWELSGNQTLKRILVLITAPLFAMSVIVRSSKSFDKTAKKARLGDHVKLIDAFLDGSVEEAAQAMHRHITQNWMSVRENFENFLQTENAGERDTQSAPNDLKSQDSKRRRVKQG